MVCGFQATDECYEQYSYANGCGFVIAAPTGSCLNVRTNQAEIWHVVSM